MGDVAQCSFTQGTPTPHCGDDEVDTVIIIAFTGLATRPTIEVHEHVNR